MSEIITSDSPAASEKPVPVGDDDKVEFPPFPEPTDDAFEDDIPEEERTYYKNKFPDLNAVKHEKLHCSACDRHLGCSARNEARMRVHPMLRTLVCHTCHTFYNSGEFDKGDDGSELYCRWCGQGGQVYCCSDCPIVFCAKCIKRNFGMPKIKEIENTDDWKCFKCNPRCLWDLRAVCWALLRFCDQRNKIAYKTEDAELKQAYQKACSVDESACCKAKVNKKKEKEAKKKEFDGVKPELQRAAANKAVNAMSSINIMTKIPPSIQVKKFASINLEESPPKEKKAQKRQAEKDKVNILKNPIAINKVVNPVAGPPLPKKIRMSNIHLPSQMPTIRFQKNFQSSYTRIRPKAPPMTPMPMTILNSYINNNLNTMMNNFTNDNINLSLENLTQGLDMNSIAGVPGMSDSDVVCTPDFPLEPLCEVTEDNQDDDVECITPASHLPSRAPPLAPAPAPPPAPAPARALPPPLPDLRPDNIIQMTEHDVTVNAATGGLKFRVDPQTLSANKMYRLPDGRVFAINPNPNMPGGYSATIVALSDSSKASAPRGPTYAAKLNPVSAPQTPSPRTHTPTPAPAPTSARTPSRAHPTRRSKRVPPPTNSSESSISRTCDLKVPVEWFRYNLIDAVDALEYSLTRLQRLKKDATTVFLRSRTVEEMRSLHKTLDSMLKTSACRFNEIKDNLNKEMKQYAKKKTSSVGEISDDDDVEILNDVNDDPISIDENSMDSTNANETNDNVTNEVDLTGPASSDHNDSGEKTTDSVEKDPLVDDNSDDGKKDGDGDAEKASSEADHELQEDSRDGDFDTAKDVREMNGDIEQSNDKEKEKDTEESNNEKSYEENKNKLDEHVENTGSESPKDDSTHHEDGSSEDKTQDNDTSENKVEDKEAEDKEVEDKEVEDKEIEDKEVEDKEVENKKVEDKEIENKEVEDKGVEDKDTNDSEFKMDDVEISQDKIQDTEMTEELIDSLLKDDNTGDGESTNLSCMDIPEDFPEP